MKRLSSRSLFLRALFLRSFSLRLAGLCSGLLLVGSLGMPIAQAQSADQGYALLQKGWVNDAITAFEQTLRQNPQSIEAKLGLAIAYQKAGRDADAWTAYQRVLVQDPNQRAALNAVGILGGYRSEWQSTGIAALTTLIKLEPTNATALAQRALLLGYQGRFTEAWADYAVILPNNPPAQVVLEAAQIYSYGGNYAESLTLFQRYLKSNSTLPDPAVTAYATALSRSGQAPMAVTLLKQRLATAKAPSPWELELRIALADVLGEQPATRSEALALYRSLTAQQPRNITWLIKQLVLERQLGQTTAAEQTQRLQAALQPLPTVAAERQILAQSLVPIDPPNPQFLSIYRELVQSSGVTVPFLHFRIAQMLVQTGDLAGATQALETYRAQATGSADVADLLLADIERRSDRLDASAQRYEALIARNPSPDIAISARRGLAGTRLAQGRIDEALQAYDQILASQPNDRSARLGRTTIAYQSQRISITEAEAQLAAWLAAEGGNVDQNVDQAPAELLSLVGALPADPKRENLYQQLLAIEPDHLTLQMRQIQVLAKRDRPAAQARFAQLRKTLPDSVNTYFVVGELAQSLGDLPLAGRSYEAILEKQPDHTGALSALAGVRFQQKQYGEATRLYRRVLALKPNDWDVQRILAELSLAQDQPFIALEQLQTVQQMQAEQRVPDATGKLGDRIVELQVDRLKRRGFQPAWERY